MEITVRQEDRFRLNCDSGNNFIDICGIQHEYGISVESYPRFHYIEIREKEGCIKTFYIKNKRSKKEIDFGWWEDAEVIFSKNNVNHNKA